MREAARGFFHPVGTCAIGAWSTATAASTAATDLSVADASIMPSIPRANTNLSTIALAERLAERMLAQAGTTTVRRTRIAWRRTQSIVPGARAR